jgi:transcriptional regulator GlxA family with amidase domain
VLKIYVAGTPPDHPSAIGRIRGASVIADSGRNGHDGLVTPKGKTRHVVLLAFPGMQPLDVAGPAEVFAGAGRLHEGAYSVEVVAPSGGAIETGSGWSLVPARAISAVQGSLDTLIVGGGFGSRELAEDGAVVEWIRRTAGRSRRIASVCTGAFLLARAGLLEGRRVATHWSACAELARRHPELQVDPEPIFVREGDVWTSAGVTAGMDLALAMVEQDLGRETALELARWLVLFLQRPGGQAQFSSQLSAQLAEREPIRELQSWIADHLDRDLRVEALAERVHMSPRNFARAFKRETGRTPAVYVQQLRVERARQRLEQGSEPVEVVAAGCGFGAAETMRRAFLNHLGVPPSDYRARFARASG